MEKATKEKTMKIISITANVLVWMFVAFAMLTTILVFSAQGSEDGVPSLFGKSLITIESPSMEPTFKQGDLVLVDKISGEDDALERLQGLKKGDIITYFAPIDINKDGQIGDINTHRIEEVLPDETFRTKGDHNDHADTYTIKYVDVIGVTTEDDNIRGVGAVISFLRSSLGFFLCILLPLVLFFLYELYRFIRILLAERAKKAPVSAEVEEEIKRRAIEEYLKAQNGANPPAEEVPAEEKKDGE